jgi:hypothetical protein
MWEDPLPPPHRVITSTKQLEEEYAEEYLIPGSFFIEVLPDGDNLKELPEYDLPPADDKAQKESISTWKLAVTQSLCKGISDLLHELED